MKKLENISQIKVFFGFFNILAMLIGIAYFGYGIALLNTIYSYPWFTKYYQEMGAIMLTIGILTILIAFFGIVCTFIRNLVLLKTFLFGLIVILAFGISIGIIGLSYASQSPNRVSQVINFKYFNESENRETIDRIQFSYGCCGINLPSDWQIFLTQTKLPSSCCSIQNEDPCPEYFKNGCFNIIRDSLSADMSISGGLSLAIALPMIIGIVLAYSMISYEKEIQQDIDSNQSDAKRKYEVTHD